MNNEESTKVLCQVENQLTVLLALQDCLQLSQTLFQILLSSQASQEHLNLVRQLQLRHQWLHLQLQPQSAQSYRTGSESLRSLYRELHHSDSSPH